jgi:A/G-specific adenine glycosylase
MLDQVNPREWYWALMDYGAYLGRTIPNPNKRSRHYTKQGGFEGSDRQIRGEIIRTLIREGRMARDELLMRIPGDDARGRALIGQLEKEGFLSDDGRLVSLRK